MYLYCDEKYMPNKGDILGLKIKICRIKEICYFIKDICRKKIYMIKKRCSGIEKN